MSIIDVRTYEAFLKAHHDALRGGRPLAEVLDQRALLLTPKRMREIREGILNDLYEAIELTGVARMLTPEQTTRGSTPAEAHRAILDFIQKYISELT